MEKVNCVSAHIVKAIVISVMRLPQYGGLVTTDMSKKERMKVVRSALLDKLGFCFSSAKLLCVSGLIQPNLADDWIKCKTCCDIYCCLSRSYKFRSQSNMTMHNLQEVVEAAVAAHLKTKK